MIRAPRACRYAFNLTAYSRSLAHPGRTESRAHVPSVSRATAFALSLRHASALGRICPQSVPRGNSAPIDWVGWRRNPYSLTPLSQRELAISVRRHRIAMFAKGRVAAAVAHDLAG